MKKNILVFIYILFILGCSQDIYFDYVYSNRASGHSLFYSEEFSSLKNEGDVIEYLWKNYSYEREYNSDIWKDPEAMVKDRAGDCDDYSLLFVNIMYVQLNIKTDIILVDMNSSSRAIIEGGVINHVVVAVGDSIYDPTNGRYMGEISELPYKIGYRYSFDEIFR
ncbi:MAG: hypothetical protein WC346_14280 [Methanogenium sp.]|jgi:hypothetical protein